MTAEDLPDVESLPAAPPPDPEPVAATLPLGRVVEALPGLARLATSAGLSTARWGAVTSWRMTTRLAAAVRDPELAGDLARELGVTVGVVVELGRQVAAGISVPRALLALSAAAEAGGDGVLDEAERAQHLRDRGEQLLMRSRDVWNDDQAHPAYDRILDELAPDEARILVLLHRDGPQPSVDVRTGGPVGMVSSRLIAPGLTMIGGRAGCRYPDLVPSYLNNVFRLGLVWFSRETLRDPGQYQVLEAQPDVLEALHSVRLTKVVRRSVHLTPFGEDFCQAVLTPDEDPSDLPAHDTPPPIPPSELSWASGGSSWASDGGQHSQS